MSSGTSAAHTSLHRCAATLGTGVHLRWLKSMGRSRHGLRPVQSRQSDNCDTVFQAELEREDSEQFRMLLGGHQGVKRLVIFDNLDSQPVMRWNDEHPNQKIEVGYVVTEVNGITEI